MRIEDISDNLSRDADGIYRATADRTVSYAEEGHAQCFQVEDDSFWFKHRNACIAAMVRSHPFDGPFLDVGGGNGYVSQRLAHDGNEVVLVEPGITGARNARLRRKLENVVCATIEDAAFHTETFGAVGLFDVIEHIQDDREFLARLAPLLKPQGRIFITVPCHAWLWSQADVEAGHFRRHTRKSLRDLLGGSFTVDYLSYFFRPLVPLQFLLRALPYRAGLGNGGVLSKEAEHGSGKGHSVNIMNRLLASEVERVARGQPMAFGASCLLAGRKNAA